MNPQNICDGVQWLGAIDWNRRLFDALIPLPDGTSYNAYLIRGTEKTALIDTVEPALATDWLRQLAPAGPIDYVISQHIEQDHSGSLPQVLAMHPQAVVICSPKAVGLIGDHLQIPPDRLRPVADGDTLELGGKTLRFVHTPWVHWPETMCTYLAENRLLFTCDFFGSHLATANLYAGDDPYVLEAAKRYYAEIMMPFRKTIQANLQKVRALEFDLIAPSHGPVYDRPEHILSAYEDWVADRVDNLALVPYISMHGSTAIMAQHLVAALSARGVQVQPFELSTTDLGKLAIALVNAATMVLGTPTVHAGAHPGVVYAAHLTNALRPKLKYTAIFGSYGWNTRVADQLAGMLPNLKAEMLGTVLCKGHPPAETLAALDNLADTIQTRHTAN